MLTISKFLIFKSSKYPNLIQNFQNFLSAEIRQVTDFRGLKLDWWSKLVIEIGSLNHP